MRTVLLTGAAALGLALAASAFAQTPSPAEAPPAAAPGMAAPASPDQAPPDQMAVPPAADQSAPAPAPRHHHHVRQASMSGDEGDHWAHQPGTGESGPASNRASNIDAADTRSAIAPHLPAPPVGEGATADSYLQAAQAALHAHKTGEAQQALEMAETRLLDRSTPVNAAGQPDQDAAVQQVANARKALASGDTQGASSAIQMAMGGAAKPM